LIDTHCHIDDEQYCSTLDEVIRRQQEGGVEAILVPGVNRRSCETVLPVCARYPGYLYPALGLHPEDVGADWRADLAVIREHVERLAGKSPEEGGLIAIGEIGLDYHWDTTYKVEQQEVLRQQLDWAIKFDLPVMIHARDAAEDTLRIIREKWEESRRNGRPLRGVMHCYSGSYEMAREYVGMGWKLGIGGVITFKNCKLADTLCPQDGRERIPLESLVLETDAPYMAPVPYRGQPNESRYMIHVVSRLAAAYGVAEEMVISVTNDAAKSLFWRK